MIEPNQNSVIIEPDYQGGGIVNLVSSLIRARGGTATLADASLLPASELEFYRHLMLLVIDGMGSDWLRRRSPDGFLASCQMGSLTSVFPSTTAAAIGSFVTGEAPAQHGITAWFTWLRELGCVMKVLPGAPRCGGWGNWSQVKDLRALFPRPPIFDRIQTASTLVSPREIANSAFNRAHQGRAKLRAYRNLGDFFTQLEQAARRPRQPSLIYGYWSELDHIGHHVGIESAEARNHLKALESGLASLADALARTDTCILVTADHGQIDTEATDLIDLTDQPELVNRLRIPLCGEPRAAFCYLSGGDLAEAEDHFQQVLGESFQIIRSQHLLTRGLFGPGAPQPELIHRIGDIALIGRGRHVICDRLLNEEPFRQIGVHGGLSPAEMLVPLCRLPCARGY